MKIKHHSIIISDIHFGSKACQSKELLYFLDNIEVKYLILNGDIFDDLRFNRLDHFSWQAFSQIRKISDHCKVVWCRGNHDIIHEDFMSCLLGVKVQSSFYWHVGSKRMVALHGDRWDIFIRKHKLTTDILTWIYGKIQDFDSGLSRRVTRWLKVKSKTIAKNGQALERGALKMAKENGIHAIFCGHTHHAELRKTDNIIYGNSGTFESDIPTYLAIDEDKISLYKFDNKKSILINSISIKGETND